MQSCEIAIGRHVAVVFEHGEDFMTALAQACEHYGIQQAFIPIFAEANLIGTCEGLDDPLAPLWKTVRVDYVEALGGGTIARNAATRQLHPHIHVATGLKGEAAAGRTSHLVSARVQFLVELLLIEVTSPGLVREPDPALLDVPLLRFP